MRKGLAALLPAVALVAGGCADVAPEPVRFTAVQPELFAGGGALTDAWADFDLDGDPDRFVGFDGAPARLYRNGGAAGFEDVAAAVGLDVERSVRTAAWGDYDADGDPDLLLGYAGPAPVTALFRNDRVAAGGGSSGLSTFTEVSGEVGLRLDEGSTRQAAWIDFDEDGDLDLFLALRDRENRLFENRGEEGFVDVAAELGVADPRRSVGASWFDVGDGRLDLIVGNMNGDANALYLASDSGFVEAMDQPAIRSGGRALGDEAQGSVRPCVVDVDADGDLDLSFANYGPNGLVVREGSEWREAGPELGLAIDSRFDTCAWSDVDHDGAVDLYVNGTVGGGTHYRDWLMRREGGPVFVDVTPPELLDLQASHGATWVDFDLDGDLDLALAGAAPDGMHHLLENLLDPQLARHSLQVRVLDAAGRATRQGSEVRLFAAGTDRMLGTRVVDAGSGYDAQSDLPVHFGVPGGQLVDVQVTVLWGGGRHMILVEGVDPSAFGSTPLTVRVAPETLSSARASRTPPP